jgi:hypothetical protein
VRVGEIARQAAAWLHNAVSAPDYFLIPSQGLSSSAPGPPGHSGAGRMERGRPRPLSTPPRPRPSRTRAHRQSRSLPFAFATPLRLPVPIAFYRRHPILPSRPSRRTRKPLPYVYGPSEPIAPLGREGWEKGQVENQAGLVRERFFTPRLRFRTYEEMNGWLIDQCVAYAKAHLTTSIPSRSSSAKPLSVTIPPSVANSMWPAPISASESATPRRPAR